MEIHKIKSDIRIMCVQAESFPLGIGGAYTKLRSLLADPDNRKFFGISNPDENGNIIYKAAAEEYYPGESEALGLESFTIKKGDYISETLINWKKDELQVSKVFQQLLQDKRIDPNGYCLEIYMNENDMMCLVPLELMNN
ncbi:MAG: transcriptional regulator [Ignavibacteria bacterium]